MTESTKTRRIMGELCFLHGDAEAAAAGAKLAAAGFKFKFTDDIDECSDDTRYMMVWRDEINPTDSEDEALVKFDADVEATIGELTESCGSVAPDHVPTRFGDYGQSAEA
jgi:hypothetical protein